MGSSTQFLHNLSSFLYTTSSGWRLHCSLASISVPLLFQTKDIGGISTRVCEGAERSRRPCAAGKAARAQARRLGELAHLRQLAAFGDLKASDTLPGGFARCMRSLRIGNKIAVPKDGYRQAAGFDRFLLKQGVLVCAFVLVLAAPIILEIRNLLNGCKSIKPWANRRFAFFATADDGGRLVSIICNIKMPCRRGAFSG